MKTFDVNTKVTYDTWVRVQAEDEESAKRKVDDMVWDMTSIQFQIMKEAKSSGEVKLIS